MILTFGFFTDSIRTAILKVQAHIRCFLHQFMEQQEIQSDTSEIKTSIKQTAIIAHWDDRFVLGTCKIN